MSHFNDGTLADLTNHINMSQVLGGYFGDPHVAEAFVETGIKPLFSSLPAIVKMADVGGGQGLLASIVRDVLTENGHQVEAFVIDSNPDFLEECNKKGLRGLQCDIRDSPVGDFDLVIMRAVLHYNSHADQIEILKSLQQTLAPSGKLVAQILTGSPMNCNLKLDLISQKTLGEDIHAGYYNCHTFDELRQMLNSIGFASVQLMGAAPDLKWTLEQQWTRFNGLINDEPRGGEGPFAQTIKTKLFEQFREDSLQIITTYIEQYGEDEINVDFTDAKTPVIHNNYQIYCCVNQDVSSTLQTSH